MRKFVYGLIAGLLVLLTSCGGGGGGSGDAGGSPTASVPTNHLYALDGNGMVFGFNSTIQTGVLATVSGSPYTAATSGAITRTNVAGSLLFAASQGLSSTVSIYSVAATGSLAPLAYSPFSTTVPKINDMVTSPNGNFLYVMGGQYSGGLGSGSLEVNSVNSSNGLLTRLTTPYLTIPYAVNSSAISSDGRFLYLLCNDNFPSGNLNAWGIQTVALDPTTGTATLGTWNALPANTVGTELRLTPDGKFLYVANGTVVYGFNVNSSTGAITVFGQLTQVTNPRYLQVDKSGRFVIVGNGTILQMFSIGATGVLTGSTAVTTPGFSSFVISPSGNFLYATSGTNVIAYSIDYSAGTLTIFNAPYLTTGVGLSSLAITN